MCPRNPAPPLATHIHSIVSITKPFPYFYLHMREQYVSIRFSKTPQYSQKQQFPIMSDIITSYTCYVVLFIAITITIIITIILSSFGPWQRIDARDHARHKGATHQPNVATITTVFVTIMLVYYLLACYYHNVGTLPPNLLFFLSYYMSLHS